MTWPSGTPLRVGFVMEQVLGHVSHYQTLRQVLAREAGLAPTWVEVTYEGRGRLEQLTQVPPAARGTMRGFLQVRDGLRGRSLDALLFHTQKPAVFQWDLMMQIPTVLSLDVTPKQYDALGRFYQHTPDGDTPLARIKHWINCRTFGLARAVVVWSHWVKHSLVDAYGVASDKIRVIPPGADLEFWRPPSDRSTSALPRVLFVGGDFTRKGGDLLLEWFRREGRFHCELDIVTRSSIASEPGVRVHRDVVSNSPAARALFHGGDVFVLPSLGECFGIASVEAMAAGLPVVATRVGGAADIVDHGRTGFLIAPSDSRALASDLTRLVRDSELRHRMGRAGRARAESEFDVVKNARALVACLRDATTFRDARVRLAVGRTDFNLGAGRGRGTR
jgi:glycosyltransferase involved in cell wall biosynthesis